MRLFVLLLPWRELFTLIQLGVKTSALTALAYVFATFVAGAVLLRRQGRDLFQLLQAGQQPGFQGGRRLLDELFIGFAGLLLLVPGLITDCGALVLVLGPLRRRLSRAIFGEPPVEYDLPRREPPRDARRETIEGSWRRLDDD